MATEADLPEPSDIEKSEGEIIYPASGYFDSTADETSPGKQKEFQGTHNVPPETVESLGEITKIQVVNDVGAEAINNTTKVNVETHEGDRFLESPSSVNVSIEDTCRVSKIPKPEEETFQTDNEALEDEKEVQNKTITEADGESGTEKNKVRKDSEQNNMSHDNLSLAGTSLQTAKVEVSNIMIEEERIIDQAEFVADQHVLVHDKSDEKEKSDPHSNDKDGTMTQENTDLLSNEQVVNILEAKSDQNNDDLIHMPGPTVISLNKSVETVIETCNKAESTTEGKSREEMKETSSTEVENKEAEKSSSLTDQVSEETKPSKIVADEKEEKGESMYEGAKDIVTSTTKFQSNEKATLKMREGHNEKIHKSSVTLGPAVLGVYETESAAAKKIEEGSSILCEEKSQDETEPSKYDTDQMNSIDTPAVKTDDKDIVNKSLHEVKEKIEMSEKTASNDITSNETGNDYESPEQKEESLLMKDEDALCVKEMLPAIEASFGGNRYEEESTVTVTKDSIVDRETIDAFEHSQCGFTNHEDRPEDLQQDKSEKQNLEGSLKIVAGEFNKAAETGYAEAITSVEETLIKSHEEILNKKMKLNVPHHTDTNVPLIELKAECAEVEAPNKNANDFHDIQALDKEAGENEGKILDEVFNSEPKGTIQEEHRAYTEEETHNEVSPEEVYQSSNSTICDQTCVERGDSTELSPKASESDTKKLQEASGIDFEEKSVIMDDEENIDQELQKNREALDVISQEISANSVDTETSVKTDSDVFPSDDNTNQHIHIESSLEVASALNGQYDSCIAEDNDKTNSFTKEEVMQVKDGSKITGSITHILPELIEKLNVESLEGNKNMAEQLEGRNSREKVTEDNKCLTPESVEQGPLKNLEESTGEISTKTDSEKAIESVGRETIKSMERPREIVYASKVKADSMHTEGRNLIPIETSPGEERNEETSPKMVAEENGDNFEPADFKDDVENVTSEFQEDSKNISQKNETEEEFLQSFSMMSDKNDSLNSDADTTPDVAEDGPTQNLEEALHIEENETKVKNETEYIKTAMEEDLEKIAETSDSRKIKESMVSKTSPEIDKKMDEDEIKKEESEEIYEDPNYGTKDEETEKHNIKEECSTIENLPEPVGEESFDSSKEDEKVEETTKIQAFEDLKTASVSEDAEKQTPELEMNVDQSREIEEEKNEQSSQEDKNVVEISTQGSETCISPLSIKQELLDNSEGNVNQAGKSEEENNRQQSIEESNSSGLVTEPESVEASAVENLEANKIKADKSSGEIFENSETSGTAEVLDTSQIEQGGTLQNDKNQPTAIDPSAVDKRNEDRGPTMITENDINEIVLLAAKHNIENKPPIGQEDSQHIQQENEPKEKHKQSLSVRSDESEASVLSADKIPFPMDILTSQDLNEVPWNEDNNKETEEKKDTKDNHIATEENLERVTVPSDASKSTESIISELKSENDQMLVQEEMKNEESEKLYDDSVNDSLREPTEDKTRQSFEEGKEEDAPIYEPCAELEATVGEDAEKQTTEGIYGEQSKELEVEKVERISKEDNINAMTSKPEECEITQTAFKDSDIGSQSIKKGGADENKCELFARRIEDYDPFVKEREENEHGKKLHEDSNDDCKDDECDKHNTKEECSTTGNLPETIEEESLQSSKEEKEEETPDIQASKQLKTRSASEDAEEQTLNAEKNDDQSKEVEEEKTGQSTQEDDTVAKMSKQGNDTHIPQVSIEQETLENSGGHTDIEENKGVHNREQSVEENNIRGLIPESVEHSPAKKLEDDKMNENKSTGEIFKNPNISGVAEIAAHESGTTIESTTEIPDIFPLKQVDTMRHEEKNPTSSEASAEEKDRGLLMLAEENSDDNEPIGAKDNIEKKSSIDAEDLQHLQQENEPEEKHESLLFVMPNGNEPLSSADDKTPSLLELETSQNLDGAPQKEENDKEIEKKNGTKDNKIEMKNHEVVSESFEAGKRIEVLELKSEEDKILVDNEIKVGESKESSLICDTEEMVQHSKQDTTSSLIEKRDVEKNSKEDESTPIQSKDQVDKSNSFKEETETASSAKETISETLKDSAEETVSETLKDGEESNVSSYPLDIMKESEAEMLPKETDGSLIEESSGMAHMLNKETEEIKEKERKTEEGITVDDLNSAPITVVTKEKDLQEVEPEGKKQEESFAPAFKKKDIAAMLESIDINVMPDATSDLGEKRDNEIPTISDKAGKVITEGLIHESAMASQTSNKETEEEIKGTEEITLKDSDSTTVLGVTEVKGLQEVESEDKQQVESFGPAFEDKHIEETMMESVDINVKPEATSDLGKKRDGQIPKGAAKTGETIDCKILNDAPHAGNGDQTEEIIDDKTLEEISKDELMECSTMKSKEMELTTAEVSETVDKPLAEDEVRRKNTETACVTHAIDDKEIKAKEEPQLEAEEHKEQNVNATTKAVMLTEKEQDEVEQSNDSEDIKYMVVEEGHANEFNDALPSVCETTDEMQDSTLICSKYNKAAHLKEKTKIETPYIGEDSAREREPFFQRESEEQKVKDISIESSAKELNIEEPQDCNRIDNASLTAETGKSSGQAEIDEKTVKAFHIDLDGPGLEATEIENCQEVNEVNNSMKLEETSELASEVIMNDNGHAEREGVTIVNRDAGEPEETKMTSEESKGKNVEEAEVGEGRMVENPDQVPRNNDEVEETKIVANAVNEIKEVYDAVYESNDQGTEEAEVEESQRVEKPDQISTHNDDHAEKVYAAKENSELDEAKIVSNSVDEINDQGAEETAETGRSPTMEKMDHNPTFEFKFKDQDTEESTVEIPAVEKLDDQDPAANSKHAEEETVTLQYQDAEEFEETKVASSLVCKSKEGSGDIDVIGKTTTEEKPDADKIEAACKEASDYRVQVITEDEITADQAPSAEKSNLQFQTQTSKLAPKTETTFSVEKIEKEKPQRVEKLEDEGLEDSSAARPIEEVCLQTEGPQELEVSAMGFKINKDLQNSPFEAYKEEGHTTDGALQLEPRGIENKTYFSSESMQSEKFHNLVSETREKALRYKAVFRSQEEVTESEDSEFKEKHPMEGTSEARTEENQSMKTRETNAIIKSEISKEEVTEKKEVAKPCQPISLCEGMNKSLQEDWQKIEEFRGDKTNNALETSLSEETEKATPSPNIGRQDAVEQIYVEDSNQVSVEDVIKKESFPDKFGRKEAKDSGIKLDPESLREERKYGSGNSETTTPADEGLSVEIPQKENIKGFAMDRNINQETLELGQSPCATTEKQLKTPTLEQQGITETPQKAEITKMIPSEAKISLEGKQTTEESELMKSAKHVSEGREPTVTTKDAEAIHVLEEAKTDEDSNFHAAPVVTEASRDVENVQVAHKKSHNILSGVGSKVKQSISKVKKAITCKSYHSMPVSPK